MGKLLKEEIERFRRKKTFLSLFVYKSKKISLSKVLKERIYIKIVPIKVNKINS